MATNKYSTRAYAFFVEKENRGETFTLDELKDRTGWKRSTIESYVAKKWYQFITKEADGKYRVAGISNLPLEAFIRLHSQKAELFIDPLRPVLPWSVELETPLGLVLGRERKRSAVI